MKTRSLKYLLISLLFPVVAHGAGCPSAKTAPNGFLLKNSEATSEFIPAQGPVIAITNTFGDSQKQTVFSFQGLIDLSRSSSDERFNIYPVSDLNEILPLTKDEHHVISFVPLNPEEANEKWTLELTVTKRETLAVGRCKYDVLRVRQEVKRGSEQVDVWSALYSPDLHATLAKVYDEGTADEAIVRYDYIAPLND